VGENVSARAEELLPRARSTLDLMSQPSPRAQGELVWRLGLAMGGINLLLLGIGLSAGNPRRGGSWNLLYALMAFIVYYNLLNLSQAWVASGRLSLGACLALVHGGTFVLALALLWWRDSGSARFAPRLRMGS
ncbi:MAG TPA: LptF/LptG family permease, partial [Methylibium sp.]